ASRSAMRFSRVIGRESGKRLRRPARSQDDAALLGELAADSPEQLVAVDAARGDLLAGGLHHPAGFLVEGALFLRLALERRVHGLPEGALSLLGEKLASGDAPRGAAGHEIFLDVGEAHVSRGDVITRFNRLWPMQWDDAAVARWLEPLSSRSGELAEIFGERRREVSV